ncbi:hypothetical protein [Rosistilla oblonga]|uniref:hypothetical protein n=1 Tax=Rosistilla oblonga TaxID=2527990 RepID=UPI003A97AD7C
MIRIEQLNNGRFVVFAKGKRTDELTFEEMLGLVAALTTPADARCLDWLNQDEGGSTPDAMLEIKEKMIAQCRAKPIQNANQNWAWVLQDVFKRTGEEIGFSDAVEDMSPHAVSEALVKLFPKFCDGYPNVMHLDGMEDGGNVVETDQLGIFINRERMVQGYCVTEIRRMNGDIEVFVDGVRSAVNWEETIKEIEDEQFDECDHCGGDGVQPEAVSWSVDTGTKWERSFEQVVTTTCDKCGGRGRVPVDPTPTQEPSK